MSLLLMYTCRLFCFWGSKLLAIIRVIIMAIAILVISIFACLYSLMRPFHRNNVFHAARHLGMVAKLLGLDVEVRISKEIAEMESVVYICNHQNSHDIFTLSNAVRPGTVSIGKKSLKWIPFFGQMYWLTGNILSDRDNKNKAMTTIATAAKKIKEDKLSVWLFPEGTRSYGRGLLPFKTGAFRTAQQAGVPIVPIIASNLHDRIKLNRWDNGKMIIEFLPPVSLEGVQKEGIRTIADETRAKMLAKFEALSEEVEHPLKKKESK